jgi:hypothetical protein
MLGTGDHSRRAVKSELHLFWLCPT